MLSYTTVKVHSKTFVYWRIYVSLGLNQSHFTAVFVITPSLWKQIADIFKPIFFISLTKIQFVPNDLIFTASTGTSNGLASNKRHAIIWIDNGLVK